MENKFYTQISLQLFLFLTIFFQGGFAYAVFENAGQARIFNVMYQGFGGIEDVNRKTLFADVKNIGFDLNIAEISKRFDCKTKMGQGFIAYKMSKPISPLDTSGAIKKSQNMIQFFLDHPAEQEKFEALLQKAVKYEATVIEFLKNRVVVDIEGNPIKFLQQFIKRNTLLNTWQLGSSVSSVVTSPERINKQFGEAKKSSGVALESIEKGLVSLPEIVSNNLMASGLAATSAAFLTKYLSSEASQALVLSGILFAAWQTPGVWDFGWATQELGWATWTTVLSAYAVYSHYAEAVSIRNSLHALNQLIDIARQLEEVCNEYQIDHQFKLSSIRSSQGKKLLDDLQHDRYKEKDIKIFSTPAVHTFVFDVYEQDNYLAPLYASIAELDAYLAIAKKMTELQEEDRKLCFAEFVDSSQPRIDAQGFWNMLVSTGSIVLNDISESRNIILTGSNEGGKTTAIRAILQNIVLAQTFGIAAASDFKLTQFDVIHSYLNISDDILHGKSRFASELKQAQDILQRIKSLQPSEKFFFAFDELFTGTNGEDGAETAYRFIDNIASYKGIQFIYATHFNKLKTIGSNNPACVNYKIEPPLRNSQGAFIRDEKGQLIYPYKLSLGANNVNVAMDRAKDAGIFA